MNGIRTLVDGDVTERSSFVSIKNVADKFNDFVDEYAFDSYGDGEFNFMFPSAGDMSSRVDLFRDDVQKAFIQTYHGLIQDLAGEIRGKYMHAVETASLLSRLLNDDYYFRVLNGMAIFKVPLPDLHDPKRHRSLGVELWKVWDPELSFTDFVDIDAEHNIEKGVRSYMSRLRGEVDVFESLLVRYCDDLKVRLDNVYADHLRHIKATTIDEAFIKYVYALRSQTNLVLGVRLRCNITTIAIFIPLN
jgi:hypothetical protein